MKVKGLIILYLLLAIVSCSKESPSIVEQIVKFEIISSHDFTIADNVSTIKIRVLISGDQGRFLPADDVIILQNGRQVSKGVTSYDFATSNQGEYNFQAQIEGLKSNTVYVQARPEKVYEKVEIPLIFHIPEDMETTEASQILADWIASVNHNFNNPALKPKHPNSVSTAVYFRLATKDPDGNLLSEAGVSRYPANNRTREEIWADWMWDYFWDPDYYMNVWIGDFNSEFSGFGTYPYLPSDAPHIPYFRVSDEEQVNRLQGIVMKLSSLNNAKHDWYGTLLEHELGHNYGLYHLHPCEGVSDAVDDTPRYTDTPGVKCEGDNMYSENIMSYEHAANHFTYGQNERIRHIIKYGRWRAQKGMTFYQGGGTANFENELGGPKKIIKPNNPKKPLYNH